VWSEGTSERRRFFRRSLAKLVRPLADRLDKHFDSPTPRERLRAPGALPEDEFLDTCQRCGVCVEVCPARAIRLSGGGLSAGVPFIDPDLAACVVCDGLLCTQECPSGALRRLDNPATIAMGVAKVKAAVCVRDSGEDCTICVDHCPIGAEALVLGGAGPPRLLVPGCVGCGLCQHHCPTRPKAIIVKPC